MRGKGRLLSKHLPPRVHGLGQYVVFFPKVFPAQTELLNLRLTGADPVPPPVWGLGSEKGRALKVEPQLDLSFCFFYYFISGVLDILELRIKQVLLKKSFGV